MVSFKLFIPLHRKNNQKVQLLKNNSAFLLYKRTDKKQPGPVNKNHTEKQKSNKP